MTLSEVLGQQDLTGVENNKYRRTCQEAGDVTNNSTQLHLGGAESANSCESFNALPTGEIHEDQQVTFLQRIHAV